MKRVFYAWPLPLKARQPAPLRALKSGDLRLAPASSEFF